MRGIVIQLDREDAAYVPGEPITGVLAWDLDEDPKSITLRLLWQTSGKGTQDMGVVHEQTYPVQSLREEHVFSLPGVDGPYSFSGKLITLSWMVGAYAQKGHQFGEQPLELSPTGQEVRL